MYFDILYDANVFGQLSRLNTFWDIMSKLEVSTPRYEAPTFDQFPNLDMYRDCQRALLDMGLSLERAIQLSRTSNGRLDFAIHMLGWNQ